MAGLDRRAFLLSSGALALAVAERHPAWALLSSADRAAVDPRLRALARVVSGPVLVPGTAAYAQARLPYNERYDTIRPMAVVQPVSVADVRQTILWARRNKVRLAARSGGHSYAGYSTTSGVVVDLRRLSAIHLNRPAGTVTLGPGARLIDVDATLAARGLAVPSGSCPTVGIGGLAMGGGVGLLGRAFGTTSDNVVALGIVTADGRYRVCDARHNADLFWACRGGGGGNFGIVTTFTLRTHAVSRVTTFTAAWPWSQGIDAVAAWQAFAPHASDRLFSLATFRTGPGGPFVRVFGQYLGTEEQLRAELRPLSAVAGLALTVTPSSFLDATLGFAGCAGRTIPECHLVGETPQGRLPRALFAAKSDYVATPLTRAGIGVLASGIERAQRAGLNRVSVLLDSYGGALNRPRADATAFVHRNALFSIQYGAYAGDAATMTAGRAWLRTLYAQMRPHVSGFAYQNYMDPELTTWRHAYYGANLPRLAQIAKKVDPDWFFRFAQGIRPAA